MSGSHSSPAPTVQPSYTSLQIQTSSNALPVPIAYGRNVLAPNIVWEADFTSIPQYTSTPSSGKGGGGGSSLQMNGYLYVIAIIMGLCEGPISAVGTIWKGQSSYSLSTVNPPINSIAAALSNAAVKDASMSLFTGTVPQSIWGYLSGKHADQAIAYPGLAYLAAPNYNLGSSGSLDITNVEIFGVLSGSTGVSGLSDGDPAQIIQDFLTNAQYGVGFPSASIDATTLLSGAASYQAYCRSTGLAFSPMLTNQEAANSILARWLQLTNTAAIWSGGKLKFIPYGDAAATGNGTTFTPDLTPVYKLTDDDFIYTDGDDPVQVARTDPYAAYNMQPIEILDRSNSYAATPLTAFDQNAIDLYGLRIASTVTAHEICDANVAMTSAQLILQRGLYIRNTYAFKLSWEYCLLEPMDLVTITDAGLGLSNSAVRIIEIDEDENGLLAVTAEEFPAGTATAVTYPVQTSGGNSVNRNIAPASVNPPLIIEPPAALTANGEAEVWIGLSGGTSGVADPNWGGAVIWISKDNTTYTAIGTVAAPARQGILTAALASAAGQTSNAAPFGMIDTANTVAVNMAASNGALNSATVSDAENGVTLCVIDQELLTYTAATLTGTNSYALTGLARGIYGSSPASHASGAGFTRLDNAIFKYALPMLYIGTSFFLKFQSFNVFGNAVQSLADCTAYDFKPVGSSLLGPVAQALAVGTNVDCGLASGTPAEYDDFGFASDPFPNFIDLGLASS
jgi:hypothetical protein